MARKKANTRGKSTEQENARKRNKHGLIARAFIMLKIASAFIAMPLLPYFFTCDAKSKDRHCTTCA